MRIVESVAELQQVSRSWHQQGRGVGFVPTMGALHEGHLRLVDRAREEGDANFKAEIGAATPLACQVQGVWVPPGLRGRGHAVHGMAAVVAEAIAQSGVDPQTIGFVEAHGTGTALGDPLFGLVPHPLAVVAHILGQSGGS